MSNTSQFEMSNFRDLKRSGRDTTTNLEKFLVSVPPQLEREEREEREGREGREEGKKEGEREGRNANHLKS
jgi:hypothetical protein